MQNNNSNVQFFSVKSISDHEIAVSFFKPKDRNSVPFVIFAHGFKGFKDWGGFPYFMQKLSASGFAAASFNFSHNGVSADYPMDFTRLELFAENSHSLELEDFNSVIDFFCINDAKFNIDKNRIALIGHSRGGGAAILKSSEDNRIKSLVTLSSVATVNRFTGEQKKKWREKGYIEIPNMRTNQMMRMNSGFLDDIENNSERLNIIKAVSKLKIPVLFIHGKEDLAVKFTDAGKLYENSDKNFSELFLIENTGHTFGTEHPFKGSTDAFETAIEKTIKFLKEKL